MEVDIDCSSSLNESTAIQQIPELANNNFSEEDVQTYMQAVLQSSNQALSAREVRGAWSSYLELVMEPTGWLAALIPSQSTAEKLGVSTGRKGASIVEVRDVLCDDLEAEVEILQSPNGIGVKQSVVEVPIDELYPLKNQECETINMAPTILAIGMIRFFYKNIWMPWDEDSDSCDWPGQHLANRVNLHFDLAFGKRDQGTAKRLDLLAHQAELNRTALDEIEEEVGLFSGDEDVELSTGVVGRLYLLHQEQDRIRREAEMLENPLLRMAVTANEVAVRQSERKVKEPSILVVWSGGSMKDLDEVTRNLKKEVEEKDHIQIFSNLQHAVDVAVPGDTIIICSEGEHAIRGLGMLKFGGKIWGRVKSGKVIIAPDDTEHHFLCVETGKLELNNLEIESFGQNVGFLVKGGEVSFDGVVASGGEIVVQVTGGAVFQFKNCKFKEGVVGVQVEGNSKGQIENCIVEANKIGLSSKENSANVLITGSYMCKNSMYGIVIRNEKCSKEGVWNGDQAVQEAALYGVEVQSSDLGFNTLGDLTVMKKEIEQLESPSDEHIRSRRFSTPLLGATNQPPLNSCNLARNSPIQSTTRVLTYFPD